MNADEENRVLRLVGLGVRGRNAVVGVDQVRRAAQRGDVHVALVATDASEHGRDKVLPLMRARQIHIIDMPSAERLGAAAGRPATTAIGITDQRLARGIKEVLGGSV